MDLDGQSRARDRGLRVVRIATVGTIVATVVLTAMFSTAAAMTFSGQTVARPAKAPVVPRAPAPVQEPRAIQIVTVAASAVGAPPQGPQTAPQAPSAAPPPPVCVGTPSKPC